MEPEDFLKRAKNPDNIPGIYNYCDRWCERCPFTSRCLNRELSSEREKELAKFDVSNKEYWDGIGKIFEDTLKLIFHVAEKQGIDLTKIAEDENSADVQKGKDAHEVAKNHLVAVTANQYTKLTDTFFKENRVAFQRKEDELNQQLQLGVNEQVVHKLAAEIKDLLEIIDWYTPQIWVKLMRALTGKIEGEEWADEHGFQRDSDGSAKVALIGIDRSLAAWGKLHDMFPEKSDEIISFLLHLDKLRKSVEQEFPHARAFKRPGFDD